MIPFSYGGRNPLRHLSSLQLESVLAAKEVDTCPSVKKIADLLPGDLFGREADSLVDNAMIGCEYDILRMSQLGSKCLLDKPDLQGQFFKCSQRAFGLVRLFILSVSASRMVSSGLVI